MGTPFLDRCSLADTGGPEGSRPGQTGIPAVWLRTGDHRRTARTSSEASRLGLAIA